METLTNASSGVLLGIAIIFILVAFGVPILNSLVFCAPDWWRKKVRPKIHAVQEVMPEKPSPPRPVSAFGKILAIPFLAIGWLFSKLWSGIKWLFIQFGKLVSWYDERWEIFVKERCPYKTTYFCEHAVEVGDFCRECEGVIRLPNERGSPTQ